MFNDLVQSIKSSKPTEITLGKIDGIIENKNESIPSNKNIPV